MQSFTADKDFPCSIKFLHGRLKIVSAKIIGGAVDAVYTMLSTKGYTMIHEVIGCF